MNKESLKKYIFSFAIIFGFLAPHTSSLFTLLHGLFPIILYLTTLDEKNRYKPDSLNILICISISISFLGLIFYSGDFEIKDIYRYFSFLSLLLLFPFAGSIKIPNIVYYFIIVVIFLSQVSYAINISILVNLFDTYYPYTGSTIGFSSEYLLKGAGDKNWIVERRYGGIYHNPNQAMKYISILLIAFLIENKQSKIWKILPYMIVAFISALLAGSRTGIIIYAISVIGFFIYLRPDNYISSKLNLFILTIATLSGVILYLYSGDSNLRVLKVSDGIDESILTKLEWAIEFLTKLDSGFFIIFGHFSESILQSKYGVELLDSEWGQAIYSFGLVGFILIINFYLRIFRNARKDLRFFCITLLWAGSSTILFSFRTSFLFLFVASKLMAESKNRKLTKN